MSKESLGKFLLAFLLAVGFFFSKATSEKVLALTCGQSGCITSSDCVPPNSYTTVTCTVQCGSSYCVGTNGICSCTTSTSTYCTQESQWGPWSACTADGYQIRWCSVNGTDTQVRLCAPTPAPTGPGGPGPTPVGGSIPTGAHTIANCTSNNGWACDADDYNQALQVNFYDGPVYLGYAIANSAVDPAVAPYCGGNAAHSFIYTTPASVKDGTTHTIYAYAVNILGGSGNPLLAGSPRTINCPAPTPTPPPTPTPVPSCTVSLSPTTTDLTIGGPDGTVTITVSCTVPVDQVTVTSSNPGSVTVTSPATTVVPNSQYETTVHAVAPGGVIITASVYAGGLPAPLNSGIAIVNSSAQSAWFQVKDADVTAGSLNTGVPSGQTFDLDGDGTYPGIPSYQTLTDLNSGNLSSQNWIAKSTSANPKTFDYQALSSQIPASTTINTIGSSSIGGSTLSSGGTRDSATGYYWYKYNGNGSSDLTLTSAANIGSRKVVLLVDSANFNINAPINVTDGVGFFMVLVGRTSTNTKGNINIDSSIGYSTPQASPAPNLEGIYLADNTISDGSGSNQLSIRGSVVSAYSGVSLARDLVGGNALYPAEFFEYAPDQILLYPPKLATRRLNWKEVAPN